MTNKSCKDIDEIIVQYGSYIYNYSLKLTCNPTKAEDIAQVTFIKAWKSLDQQKIPPAMKSWLSKICLNTFLEELRKEKRQGEILYEEMTDLEQDGRLLTTKIPLPEDEILVEESIKELQNGCFLAMVRRLTLNQRIAFSLVDMFGLSLEEVSEILNISKSAAKGLLYRGRMNIDSFFADHCNIIDSKNPCSCKAWIDFSSKRSELQRNEHRTISTDTLDYRKKGYIFHPGVRGKIEYLYRHMPERKPGDEWYHKVKETFNEIYQTEEIQKY